MGSSSKAKTVKAGVAKKSRAVLGGSRAVKQGTASSARSKAKAKTKAKAKASKAKSKGESKVEVIQTEVAEPSYYPKGMLGFCAEHLDALEMDILKRLVRLHQKDTVGDVKKLLHVLHYYYPKQRTTEEVFNIVADWTAILMNHDRQAQQVEWEQYWNTRVPYIAEKFIRAMCLQSQDKLDLICSELKELGRSL